MTQEDKKLLIKDLCARLPYGIVIQTWYNKRINIKCVGVNVYTNVVELDIPEDDEAKVYIDNVKPYLFPMSSMTEEQAIELFNIFGISLVDSIGANYIKVNEITGITFFFQNGFDVETHLDKLIDWLHKNHFDYRCLIEKGLAIDATGLNIY